MYEFKSILKFKNIQTDIIKAINSLVAISVKALTIAFIMYHTIFLCHSCVIKN